MKNIAIIISILFSVILFSSCNKDTVWVYYDETGCADKWGVASVPEKEKTKNVKKYLSRKGIHVVTLQITNDGILETCKACHCKTGKRITCEIYENDLKKAINEIFYLSKTE